MRSSLSCGYYACFMRIEIIKQFLVKKCKINGYFLNKRVPNIILLYFKSLKEMSIKK